MRGLPPTMMMIKTRQGDENQIVSRSPPNGICRPAEESPIVELSEGGELKLIKIIITL